MKKFLSICLVMLMVLSFAACGDNKDDIAQDGNSNIVTENSEEDNNGIFDNDKITVEKVKNAPETSADDFITEVVDGGISINKYNGNDEIVVIPEKIDGMPVVAIGEMCFANNKEIKAVKICDNVAVVEKNAFANCFNLEVFISGKNVDKIGDYALSYCSSLNYLELNDGIKSLERLCFGGTDSLTELYMPASITEFDFPFLATQTNVTITCEAGSAAETYAIENGINYETK